MLRIVRKIEMLFDRAVSGNFLVSVLTSGLIEQKVCIREQEGTIEVQVHDMKQKNVV